MCCMCILKVISVTFNELSLEFHTTCSYDSVSLYDGSSDNSPLLGRFCAGAASTITSSNSSLFVIFQTDQSVNKGRFALNWTFDSEGGQGWFFIRTCLAMTYKSNAMISPLLYFDPSALPA